jgi:uncharacterized protein
MGDTKLLRIETFRLKPGEDVRGFLEDFTEQEKIEAAFIVTGVGSLTQATIRFASQNKPARMTGHFEITSLVGTLSKNGSHVHITIADEKGNCKGGHLMKGCSVYTTAEIVIGILPTVTYLREIDNTFGYKELIVNK